MPRGILTREQKEKQLKAMRTPEYRKKISERMKEVFKTKDMTERNKKISISRLGDKHPFWKGDNVSYTELHAYVNRHFPKPNKCSKCNLIKRLEAHNISMKYKRDLSDWIWVCRSCHNKIHNKRVGKRKYESL